MTEDQQEASRTGKTPPIFLVDHPRRKVVAWLQSTPDHDEGLWVMLMSSEHETARHGCVWLDFIAYESWEDREDQCWSSGHVKWDGCSNVDDTHLCGPGDVERLSRLLTAVYFLARPKMSNPMYDAVPMPWGLRMVDLAPAPVVLNRDIDTMVGEAFQRLLGEGCDAAMRERWSRLETAAKAAMDADPTLVVGDFEIEIHPDRTKLKARGEIVCDLSGPPPHAASPDARAALAEVEREIHSSVERGDLLAGAGRDILGSLKRAQGLL